MTLQWFTVVTKEGVVWHVRSDSLENATAEIAEGLQLTVGEELHVAACFSGAIEPFDDQGVPKKVRLM